VEGVLYSSTLRQGDDDERTEAAHGQQRRGRRAADVVGVPAWRAASIPQTRRVVPGMEGCNESPAPECSS
jgi:hypothetical protein